MKSQRLTNDELDKLEKEFNDAMSEAEETLKDLARFTNNSPSMEDIFDSLKQFDEAINDKARLIRKYKERSSRSLLG